MGSFGKGVLWKQVLSKMPISRDSRQLREIPEILQNPQSVEREEELEFSKNLEIVKILEVPPVKDPFRNDFLFPFPI